MTRPLFPRRRRAADPVLGVTHSPVPAADPPAAGIADPTPPASAGGLPQPSEGGPASIRIPLAPDSTPAATPRIAENGPAELEATKPSFRHRGRARRRLRYLRRVRELAFRDLGGLTFDLHRFGREGTVLVAGKLEALSSVDAELRTLESALDDHREYVVLREPGIAACPACAALHGSEAHFCPNCGLALDTRRTAMVTGDRASAAPPDRRFDGPAAAHPNTVAEPEPADGLSPSATQPGPSVPTP